MPLSCMNGPDVLLTIVAMIKLAATIARDPSRPTREQRLVEPIIPVHWQVHIGAYVIIINCTFEGTLILVTMNGVKWCETGT